TNPEKIQLTPVTGVRSMKISNDTVAEIVQRVIGQLAENGKIPARDPGEIIPGDGVFKCLDEAVAKARIAHKRLVALNLEKRFEIIAAIRKEALKKVEFIARFAHQETGMGRYEDKVNKNKLAITKTPGPEDLSPQAFTGDSGLTLEENAPYGVIGSITPSTNPTETILNNGIGMLSAGNAVVFGIHPRAKRCCQWLIQFLNRTIESAGGPPDLMSTIYEPSLEGTQNLMRHQGSRLLVVTGGPGVVSEAFKSGKKVMAAGPGNPPAVVDETADIPNAAKNILAGSTLDNNIVCIAEKEIVAVASIADRLTRELKDIGAVEIGPTDLMKLERLLITPDNKVNVKFCGKNASVILEEIGIRVADSTRMIFTEVEASHPFVQHELLMPVIPLVRVPDVETAIELAVDVEHGFCHTATMHSKNIDNLHNMAVAFDGSIFVKNGPSFAGIGLGGEGFTSFTICSPTGEGLTRTRTFVRRRRCTLVDHFRIV
ncbi:aldehyde dehydrogenase family protein, partial [Candidatus Riflebacteria bacterium]